MSEQIAVDPVLFEDMVNFYSEFFHLPPLASKIHTYLIFDLARRGITFEEIVEEFSVSKSTVSTSLHLLLHLQLIREEKSEGRKRRFFINHGFTKIRFEQLLQRLQKEDELLGRLSEHFAKQGTYPKSKFGVYRDILKVSIQNIENALRRLYHE